MHCARRSTLGATLGLGVALAASGSPAWAQMALPEDRKPVVAEAATDGVPVYAYPKHDSDKRRELGAGDLVRVVGEAPGVDGDTTRWFATTEGFVERETLQPSSGRADGWTLPEKDAAPNGWWGKVGGEAHVRTAASLDVPTVGTLAAGARVKVLGEQPGTAVAGSDTWYRIDGGRYAGGWVHSSLIARTDQPSPNATPPDPPPADGNWITVDRSARTLTLVQGGNPVFTTYVSIGKAGAETPTGRYEILAKQRFDDMTSLRNPDALNSYYLPNVPYVQYYRDDGSAIHGTYWHDDFGAQESQGCINLTITDAAYLFDKTGPEVGDGQTSAWSTGGGTPVQIVD